MKKYSNYKNNKLNDVSRIAWTDLIPKSEKNGDINSRLSENVMITQRSKFDDSNNIINSLQSEILDLKKKLSYLSDKDKEIHKLKFELTQLSDINKKIVNSENNNQIIQNEKSKLLDEILSHKQTINNLEMKNDMLTNEIKLLKNILPTKDNHDIKINNESIDINENDMKLIQSKTIVNPEINVSKKENTINFDYDKYINIMKPKSTYKQIINTLDKYNINNNCMISKSTLQNITHDILK